MKIIIPTTITDAMFVSSDVAEDDYDEFSMATSYSPGDIIMDTTGVEILTLDVAPAVDWAPGDLLTGQTSAETCRTVAKLTDLTYQVRERTGDFTLDEIIGVTGDGDKLADQGAAHPTITEAANKIHEIYEALTAGAVELLTLDVAPATAWVAGRTITGQTSGETCTIVAKLTDLTYQIINRSGAFTLDEVIGVTGISAELADQGAAHPTVATASNTANYPATDLERDTPLWWSKVSPTNRWKAFDLKVGTQVSQADLISFSLTPGMSEGIAFLNLEASSITMTMTDPVEGEVYNETVNLVMTDSRGISLIYDWYSYFFGTAPTTTDVVKLDLLPYPSATIAIAISNPGLTAKVGAIVVGMLGDLGDTGYGTKLSINDYSSKTADSDGNFSITERAFAKRMTVPLELDNFDRDEMIRVLAQYRATPLVWVNSEDYASEIVFGFYKRFSVVVKYKAYSTCEIEIEGLT
ncbi:MAG: hypothetical protein JRD89_16755 [Deltaproteobacteria bacterium]|nr:hypothetical protein [Deltaproteobacteria bacterium]